MQYKKYMQIQASQNLAGNRNQIAYKCNMPRDIYTVPWVLLQIIISKCR